MNSESRSKSPDLSLSQNVPRRDRSRERENQGNSQESSFSIKNLLEGLQDPEKDQNEVKMMTSILKQQSQRQPKSMVHVDQVSEQERKTIENSLQVRGLKRSIHQVKKAKIVASVLSEMRATQGTGVRFPWNITRWQRTLKCFEDDTIIPKLSDMESYEQISLAEQVDFASLNLHNTPRSNTHSDAEKKAINKAQNFMTHDAT